MPEFTPNTLSRLHGFNTAVLTQKKEAEPSYGKASNFAKAGEKARLFLISKGVKENHTLNNKQRRRNNPAEKRRNRKQVSYSGIFCHNGKRYKVNSAKSGLYVEIITKIVEQFEIAAQKWRRVFVLRFDLHTDHYTNDNKLITDYRKRLFQRLKREYGFKHIGFCWVREQERAKAQHYHWVLFLDGNLIRHSKRINDMIKQAWERPTGGFHVPVIKRPFYFVNSEQIAQEAIYRISYLAKTRGKGHRDKQAKDYQCSRMK